MGINLGLGLSGTYVGTTGGGGAASATFGALTLAGAGAVAKPAGATSITNAGGTNLVISGSTVVPDTGGGVTSGTVTFDDATEWAVTATPGEYSVASVAQLEAAHSDAGTTTTRTARMRAGDYSGSGRVDLDTASKRFTGRFTVAADTGASVILGGIDLDGNDNITLSGIDLTFAYTGSGTFGVIEYSDTNDLIVEDCEIYSTAFSTLTFHDLPSSVETIGAQAAAAGVKPTGAIFRRCNFHDLGFAVEMNGGATVTGCLIEDCGAKFLSFTGDVTGATVLDTFAEGIWVKGGSLGGVGPNNPTGSGALRPYDQGSDHSVLLGWNPTTSANVSVTNSAFLVGTNRWDQLGDYHGDGPRMGMFDSGTTTGVTFTNVVCSQTAANIDLDGVSGTVGHNSFVIDNTAKTKTLAYDGGTVDFTIGALLTASSGGSYRVCNVSGTTAAGTLTLSGSGTISDNDTLTDGSGGAAVANGVPTGVDSINFNAQTVGDLTLKHNIGSGAIAAAQIAGANPLAYTKSWNNVPLDQASPSSYFTAGDIGTVSLDDFQTVLSPATGGRLDPTNAPEVGAINSYITWATGVGTTSYSASSGSLPATAKTVSTLTNGTALTDLATFNGTSSYIQAPTSPLSGSGTDLTIAFGIQMESGADGVAGKIFDTTGEAIRLEKFATNLLYLRAQTVGNVDLFSMALATPLVEADGLVNFVITFSDDGTVHVLRDGNLDGFYSVSPTSWRTGLQWDTSVAVLTFGKNYTSASEYLPMSLSHVWIDDVFVDLFSATEMSKWIGLDGEPGPFGANGSTPTGTQPQHFLLGDDLTANLGSGSNWTETDVSYGDVTAPTLSSPTDAADGATASTASVSTDEGNGTLYWVVTTSATAPSAAQVKLGQDNSGTAATDSGSQAVSGTGVQTVTPAPSGLTASTAYTTHFMHEDSSSNQSDVSSASGFTTAASYTQTLYDTQGTAYMESAAGFGTPAQMEFSIWYKPQSIASNYAIVEGRGDLKILQIDSRLQFIVQDSAETVVYNGITASSTFAAGTLYHVYVAIDLSVPSVVMRVDGVDVAPDPASVGPNAGTGLVRLNNNTGFLADRNGALLNDCHFGDMFMNTGTLVGYSTLYNSGAPFDLGATGTGAIIWVGGDRTVAQLNAFTNANKGTEALVAGSGTFAAA